MSVKIYSIEGNIGSGKSTFIAYWKSLQKDDSIIFIQEPVDEWNTITDKDNITILEKFYENKERYAFSFQMMAYISRLAQIKNIIKTNKNKDIIIIMERCVYTDRNVFAKMLYDNKEINEIDYKIYNKWFDYFIEDIKFNGIIYIKSNPKIAYDRVLKRNRKGENIPIEYLEKCSKYHDDWIIDNNVLPQLILNGNKDNGENLLYNDWINKVTKFLNMEGYDNCKWLTGC